MDIHTPRHEPSVTGCLEAITTQLADGLAREYGTDEAGTLEHLLHVCEDAADGAGRIAELLSADDDPDTAELFRNIAEKRMGFARRLALLLANSGHQDSLDTKGTFRGKLFRWRLQIAKQIPVGYNAATDRRCLLRIARRGSDLVTRAYADAAGRPLGPQAQEEIHRQAKAIRASNVRIRQLAENA